MDETDNTEIEESNLDIGLPEVVRRRKRFPWWMVVFIWLFMIFGAIAPIAFVFGVIGVDFQLSLFGFETNEPISLMGIGLILLFAFKGIVALGLWIEKDWAIKTAVIDAIFSIALATFSMFIYQFLTTNNGFKIEFRLELILSIAYFWKLKKLQKEW